MPIRKLHIKNFKSFDHFSLELRDFTVLIGANGAGKSNFIQILRFLRDIELHGLNNAISLQGGIEYVRNISIGRSEPLYLSVTYDRHSQFAKRFGKQTFGFRRGSITYEFELYFHKKGPGFQIVRDRFVQTFDIVELERQRKEFEEKAELGSAQIVVNHDKTKIDFRVDIPKNVPLKMDDLIPKFFRDQKISSKTLLLEALLLPMIIPFGPPPSIFADIAIYDFDPKLPKKAAAITGKTELDEDASNLAIVLKNIRQNREKRRKFENLIADVLPFVTKLDVDRQTDKSLLFKLKERYAVDTYIPAFALSDGTVTIAALIVALYFHDVDITAIEEPERRVHPFIMGKIVELLKDAARSKQVLITTHNPEVVRHVELDNMLLLSRDKKGFSTATRPVNSKRVKIFLKNEMSVDELYVQNLLKE